jgi:hypothetical protein
VLGRWPSKDTPLTDREAQTRVTVHRKAPTWFPLGSFGLSTGRGATFDTAVRRRSAARIEADMQLNPTPLRSAAALDALEAHQTLLLALRDLYAPNVTWVAPAREIRHSGREEVIRHLLREASAMREPEYSFLRRSCNERQIIDEYAVRFVCAGAGFDKAPIDAGDFVELKRVRILDLAAGKVALETCIENWTVLLPAGAQP